MAAPTKPKTPEKDRVDLKLFNTIVIFDVYTVGRSPEETKKALLAAIAAGDAAPTEITAREITSANSLRASWLDQAPYVAGDVTDEEFETLKGITTGAAYERFYKRKP